MPSKGVSLRRIPDGLPGAGIAVFRLHYSADPTMTPERLAGLRKMYTSEDRFRREMEIDYFALEGERMFPEFDASRNVCPPFDVSDPHQWSIWMACDPHMRTPHAFAWVAYSVEGEAVQCGELWPQRQYTVREYAETIEWLESDSASKPPSWEWAEGKRLRIARRVMDTHGAAANSDEGVDFFAAFRAHGLHFYPAKKSQQVLAAARDTIGSMLIPSRIIIGNQETEKPMFRVFSCCPEATSEFINVRYPPGEVERKGQEKPRTYRKHVIDCVLYITTANPSFVPIINPAEESQFVPIYKDLAY